MKPPVETSILNSRLQFLGFHMPGLTTHPYTPNKKMAGGREKKFITQHRHAKKTVLQFVFSHLRGTDMTVKLKQTKN
jgi:hypothetical protein